MKCTHNGEYRLVHLLVKVGLVQINKNFKRSSLYHFFGNFITRKKKKWPISFYINLDGIRIE